MAKTAHLLVTGLAFTVTLFTHGQAAASENEPIVPNQTAKKKQYVPPQFEVLTRAQAKAQLIERGLPGEAATEQLLKAASKP